METLDNRSIAHMDLDSFFVSVERLRNSALLNKPIIIGGHEGRGVVASCSYEARKFGVHSAMPAKMAKQLCPDAIFIKGDMEEYSKHSKVVTQIIEENVPLYEKSSIDEFYLDLTGMDRFFGAYKWLTELRQTIIKESGLPISTAFSINKTVSKIGTGEAKPNGQMQIPFGTEKGFLAPMPIQKMPMLGKVTAQRLQLMGIQRIGTLSQLDPRLLEREFGKNGISIWKKANGIDLSPVEPYREQKSMSKEHTFSEDTAELNFIKSWILKLTEQLAFELRKQHKVCAMVAVKIRYADFNTYTKQRAIAYTASDKILIETAKEIFEQLYQRRVMIRLIGVRFSNLVHGNHQINLFDDTAEEIKLYQAMDNIRNKFGKNAVFRAGG
jgi:DNA polymerase-4